jgi:SAM-dependent methyltransferase
MRNRQHWTPTKFKVQHGLFGRGSRLAGNIEHVNPASLMICDMVAAFYQRAIPKYCAGSLLDLGCGHVPLYETYRGHVHEITCVDWAETLHSNQYLDVVHDLTSPLPFEDNQFDTVLLSDVLEHIPTPDRLLDEIVRVLKPNGHLLINVPFYYGIHESPHDFFRFTEYALRRFASQRSLEIVELNPTGGVLEVLSDILLKQVGGIPLVGRTVATIGHYLSILFRANPLAAAIQRLTEKNFPYFYSFVARKAEPTCLLTEPSE